MAQTLASTVLRSNFLIASTDTTTCGFCGKDLTAAAFDEWEAWADMPMCKECSDALDQQHIDNMNERYATDDDIIPGEDDGDDTNPCTYDSSLTFRQIEEQYLYDCSL